MRISLQKEEKITIEKLSLIKLNSALNARLLFTFFLNLHPQLSFQPPPKQLNRPSSSHRLSIFLVRCSQGVEGLLQWIEFGRNRTLRNPCAGDVREAMVN
jgi:hypothetical protein